MKFDEIWRWGGYLREGLNISSISIIYLTCHMCLFNSLDEDGGS